MSTGKRLAKRSILGTRVSVLGLDGLWSAGMIQAVKTQEEVGIGGGLAMPNRYSVRFDDPPIPAHVRRATEFLSADICGPGFKSVSEIQLAAGQPVYVTHNGREMKAKVVRHDFESQDVILKINEAETQLKKIDEIRLLESRKSARLVNSDTDFSKLADVNISPSSNGFSPSSNSSRDQSRKTAGARAIAVPDRRTDYVQIAGSRKRRTSETVAAAAAAASGSDCEETMTECSAAMLLMKLSCSPMTNTAAAAGGPHHALNMSGHDQRPPSVDSSSGASSFRSSTPSPPLSSSAATDEGIVKDLDRSGRVIYQCTYRGCGEQHITVRSIEAHVRKEHLLKEDPDKFLEEGEEEFYYTEVEDFSGMSAMAAVAAAAAAAQAKPLVTSSQPFQFGSAAVAAPGTTLFTFTRPRSYSSSSASSMGASQLASLSLVDHLDMARPAHEDPGRGAVLAAAAAAAAQRSILVTTTTGQTRSVTTGLAVHTTSPQARNTSAISMPITIAPSAHGSPGKYILISPPHRPADGMTSPVAAFPSSSAPSSAAAAGVASAAAVAAMVKSPTRRVRDGKKCRKVYGLEQRDLWCTQCKWKKACARFGNGATTTSGAATSSRPTSDVLSTSSPAAGSLLMAANTRIIGTNAARAIKF